MPGCALRRLGPQVKMTAPMKKEIPGQLIVAAVILLVGGIFVGVEYLLVKWYPGHQQRVNAEALRLVPYRNAELGVEMQVAAGIYGKVESFPGGAKIYHSNFWRVGPSLTLTSQPNPDKADKFSPQALAQWQTQGVYQEIPRYRFESTTINHRDAVLIWQFKGRAMVMTARIISPDRIIEAACTPGQEDETLYLQACDETVHTIKVAGPEPPPPPPPPALGVRAIADPAGGHPGAMEG